ncbi:MAG: nucleotidyl transferase AbiEii/AbiGii toxin family protein [Candidatus Omnitrophota bacterium]|nr:nucleotidyl transferase AbiEii/AbiGii toxin family protein [Candidatus Omnitrophota bacterium]
MLTYEALTEQAKTRGMPATKIRGVLREYLQILILKELGKNESGKKLYFTGGTYLRLAHNLKRFSEDLDFNSADIKKVEFENLVDRVKLALDRISIKCRVKFKHWDNIYASDIIFPDIEKSYGTVSRYSKKEGVVIKIETNKPRWKIKGETEVIGGFGEIYPCLCTNKGALLADKIDALNKKTRGRHLYDIVFMLSRRYPVDKTVIAALGIKEDPLDLVVERVKSFSTEELKRQAEGLRPFLFEEEDANLIINAHQIMPSLIADYRSAVNG